LLDLLNIEPFKIDFEFSAGGVMGRDDGWDDNEPGTDVALKRCVLKPALSLEGLKGLPFLAPISKKERF
jgi:hypothetical protein